MYTVLLSYPYIVHTYIMISETSKNINQMLEQSIIMITNSTLNGTSQCRQEADTYNIGDQQKVPSNYGGGVHPHFEDNLGPYNYGVSTFQWYI